MINISFIEAPEPAEIASTDDFTDAISKEDWDALRELADTRKGNVDIDVIFPLVVFSIILYKIKLSGVRKEQGRAQANSRSN